MNVIEKKKDKEMISVAIEGDAIINSVAELKSKLLKYFKDIRNMEFDLSSVEKIDTAGFQLLTMIKKEVESKEKTFKIVNPSEEIKRIFNLYGESI
jgi:anti-sigma B factor antagonist